MCSDSINYTSIDGQTACFGGDLYQLSRLSWMEPFWQMNGTVVHSEPSLYEGRTDVLVVSAAQALEFYKAADIRLFNAWCEIGKLPMSEISLRAFVLDESLPVGCSGSHMLRLLTKTIISMEDSTLSLNQKIAAFGMLLRPCKRKELALFFKNVWRDMEVKDVNI